MDHRSSLRGALGFANQNCFPGPSKTPLCKSTAALGSIAAHCPSLGSMAPSQGLKATHPRLAHPLRLRPVFVEPCRKSEINGRRPQGLVEVGRLRRTPNLALRTTTTNKRQLGAARSEGAAGPADPSGGLPAPAPEPAQAPRDPPGSRSSESRDVHGSPRWMFQVPTLCHGTLQRAWGAYGP